MAWVQVCEVNPVNGVCPEPMVWVETAANMPLTFEQFLVIAPKILGLFFIALGVKLSVRMMLNFRG